MNERLQKLIAHSGLTSRRGAEELIKQGRVTVDGEPAHLGQKVDVASAHVEVDGVPLPVDPRSAYYLLNKPAGVVSTAHDPQGRPTVVELVPQDARLYPVGRLDSDSEGLILLTNDGTLTDLITHPRYGIAKTYAVLVEGAPSRQQVRRLTQGVLLDDGPARARSARLLDRSGRQALVEVVMGEGRKREVRRMFEALGLPVVRLARTAIGPIRDPSLGAGAWRRLSLEEVRSLYQAAATGQPVA
ncbi:MAG: rRNA pseudouridine synthase [Actinomycetota bacterium]|nr:rRNA pseudouridine synthase [Actinomycetota bacterium]